MTIPQWNFDMEKAPRGNMVETQHMVAGSDKPQIRVTFVPERVWIAHPDGKVYPTYWVRATKFMDAHWSGMTPNTPGIAWMAYEKPIHPYDLGIERTGQ